MQPSTRNPTDRHSSVSRRPSPADQRVSIINDTIRRDIITFMYPDPHLEEPIRDNGAPSPAAILFATVPKRGSRPLSTRAQPLPEQTMFQSAESAPQLLDLEYLCHSAMSTFGDTFPPAIWTCCQNVCFASLATGRSGSPRFFDLVKRIHSESLSTRQEIISTQSFIQPSVAERRDARSDSPLLDERQAGEREGAIRVTAGAKEKFKRFAQKYIPVLLGQKSHEGVFGRLCVFAVKKILGVSLNFLYKRRVVDDEMTSMIDLSGSRQRALRRIGNREGLTPFNELPNFDCGCVVSCLTESTPEHLEALYEKFLKCSTCMRPYESENEFLMDLLYCPLTNADSSMCDRAVAQILALSSRRVRRARTAVLNLVSNPSLLSKENNFPSHGMYRYSSLNHPMNRVDEDTRKAIAQGLDMVTRADPSGVDGSVTYRFYDPSVNSYEKIQQLLHRNMSRSLRVDIGDISSTTFRRIFHEFLAERDGRLSMARADHNCCPHCQELELAVSALEMELKASGEDCSEEVRNVLESKLLHAQRSLKEHNQWDRRVRRHLRTLVQVFQKMENDERERRLRTTSDARAAPGWNSNPHLALLSHQDDMTKADIPYFMRESLATLTRYRYDVSAHVSAITGCATVLSHEQGTSQKTSGSVFEGILIEHLLTCRGEGIKIVWSDCASVGRSFFSCVACPQYLVDSGLCNIALFGFMANCHGKYLADSLFGQWKTRAKNMDITSIDAMLRVFESIKRSNGAQVSGLVVNPVSSVKWQENLTNLGYATTPPPDFRWEEMNPHYACACKPGIKESIPPKLKDLLEPLMPQHDNCVRITSWPYFTDTNEKIPFQHRSIDVPASSLSQKSSGVDSIGCRVDEWYLAVGEQ